MSALVFSHYCVTGGEGADFHVGSRPVLDPYDGFFDQALDGRNPSDVLFFLLNEGQFDAVWEAQSPDECRVLRNRLDDSVMITGHLVEVVPSFTLHVDQRETFRDVLQRRPAPTTNEALEEVAWHRQIWQSVRAARSRMGQSYRFRFVGHLPRVSSVERALTDGLQCGCQMDFGSRPPSGARRYPLMLEPVDDAQRVRVIAIGSNDIDSCRIFDVTDVTEYRAAIATALQEAELAEEIACWEYLSG